MVDNSVTPALGVMELVAQWDAATLLPIIQQHIRPGTIVWSDMWAAYNNIQHIPLWHNTRWLTTAIAQPQGSIPSTWNRIGTESK